MLSGRRAVWLAGAVVLVALVVWALAFSSVFGAKDVKVTGVQSLSPDAIRTAADIHAGTPLVRLDTAAVGRRVQALAEVQTATVRTRLPSTVTITVVERKPVGYATASEGYMLIDKTGHQFRAVRVAPAGLPRLVVPAAVETAGSILGDAGVGASSVAAALPPDILRQVASIEANSPSAITLRLADGRAVVWGSAGRTADKAALLPTLLTRPGSVIDLSDPDQVYTR